MYLKTAECTERQEPSRSADISKVKIVSWMILPAVNGDLLFPLLRDWWRLFGERFLFLFVSNLSNVWTKTLAFIAQTDITNHYKQFVLFPLFAFGLLLWGIGSVMVDLTATFTIYCIFKWWVCMFVHRCVHMIAGVLNRWRHQAYELRINVFFCKKMMYINYRSFSPSSLFIL